MNRLSLLSLCCVLGIGATAWSKLAWTGADAAAVPTGPAAAAPNAPAVDARLQALRDIRRGYRAEDLDRFVTEQRALTGTKPLDPVAWRVLAEALLERVLAGNRTLGLRVGEARRSELPAAMAQDLDEALAAIARGRKLGDDGVDSWRLEGSLLGSRITGIGTALTLNPRIQEAFAKAGARGADDPALHVALGMRFLLAPRFLGHDPEQALAHFEFAMQAMPWDERPGVFAAFALWLQHKRQKAIEYLERASAANPANVFSRVVLERVRRDEDDPFGRDLTAAELAGGR